MPITSERRPLADKPLLDGGLIVAAVTLALSLSAFIGYAGYVSYYALPIEFIQLDFTSIAKFWTGVLGFKIVVFSGVLGGLLRLMQTATAPLIGHIDDTTQRFTRRDIWRVPAALLVASLVTLLAILLVTWLFTLARQFLAGEWMEGILFTAAVFVVASCVAAVRSMQATYTEFAATVAARQMALAAIGPKDRQSIGWRYRLPARWMVATFGALFGALCVYFVGWTEAESRRDYFVFQDEQNQVLVLLFSDKGAVGYDFKVCADGRPILSRLHVLPLDAERQFVPARFSRPIEQRCVWQPGDFASRLQSKTSAASDDIVDRCLRELACSGDRQRSNDATGARGPNGADDDDAGPGGP